MKQNSAKKPKLKAISGSKGDADFPDSNATDEQLLARIREGDSQVFREIVRRYQARAYQIAFGIMRSHDDAEDVVQEAFVKAYLSLENFRGDSSFYTWLYRIVYNMAIDVRRKLGRTDAGNSEFDESLLNSNSSVSSTLGKLEGPDEAVDRKEKGRQIRSALAQLTEEHRTVVLLREFDGMSYDDIAEITKVNKGTVMSRLHYARRQLQKLLADLR